MVRKLLRYTGKRYLIGFFGPFAVGSILLYLTALIMGLHIDARWDFAQIMLYSYRDPFMIFMPTIFVIAFMVLGVQSIVYSFVMEHLVLRFIKNKYIIMLLSAGLCLLFPFFGLISLAKPGEPCYAIDLSFYVAGGLTGIILGYTLYRIYYSDMQYAKWVFIKKNLDHKKYDWLKQLEND